MEKWFEIGGWNIQAQYAYGTETEAQHYADISNGEVTMYEIHEIWEKHAAALAIGTISPAFIAEVQTHCGYDMTDSEVARIAEFSKDADDFDSIWSDQDWWLDRFNGMDDY